MERERWEEGEPPPETDVAASMPDEASPADVLEQRLDTARREHPDPGPPPSEIEADELDVLDQRREVDWDDDVPAED